jgi:hypothetical protein
MAYPTCSVPECPYLARAARGLCWSHYHRLRRLGTTDGAAGRPRPRTLSMSERFWSKVDKSGDCWLWTGTITNRYGRFFLAHGRMTPAHRWAYESLVGPIPEGLTIDHLCRNPPCVNPDHLEPVTVQENVRRALPFIRARVSR